MSRSSRTRPPSSSQTGSPRALPRMSHSAMSIALTTFVTAPRLPAYVKARNTLCQVSSIRAGSSPATRSLACRTIAAIPRFAVGVVVVISPQPVTPSSVRTSTNRYSPQPVPSAATNHGTTSVIFIRPPPPGFLPPRGRSPRPPRSCRRGGAALADAGGLLERVPGLQHRELPAVRADDLQAHRQPVRGEPCGHRERRVAGGRDVVGRAHPVEVAGVRDAVDLRRVLLLDRERRDLRDRQQEQVVAGEELAHPVVERGVDDLGAGQVGAGEPPAL